MLNVGGSGPGMGKVCTRLMLDGLEKVSVRCDKAWPKFGQG